MLRVVGSFGCKHVVVMGVGGGVGLYVVQFVSVRGAWVTVVCSVSKEGFV